MLLDRGEGLFWRGASVQAHSYSCGLKVKEARPFDEVSGFPVDGQQMTVRPVSGLLLLGRPPAILGRVTAIVVDPINGVTRRGALSHIRQKTSVIAPLIAHDDAAAAVISEILTARIGAALEHAGPYPVCRADAAYCVAVLALNFSAQATTRPDITPLQVATVGDSSAATRASADPINNPRRVAFSPADYGQSSEHHACKVVNRRPHNHSIIARGETTWRDAFASRGISGSRS